jgi:hypothetical protein
MEVEDMESIHEAAGKVAQAHEANVRAAEVLITMTEARDELDKVISSGGGEPVKGFAMLICKDDESYEVGAGSCQDLLEAVESLQASISEDAMTVPGRAYTDIVEAYMSCTENERRLIRRMVYGVSLVRRLREEYEESGLSIPALNRYFGVM